MKLFTLILVVWFIFGLWGGGIVFSDMQDGFPTLAYGERRQDRALQAFFTLTGPIGLLAAYGIAENPKSVRFRAYTREESKAAWDAKYSVLPYPY